MTGALHFDKMDALTIVNPCEPAETTPLTQGNSLEQERQSSVSLSEPLSALFTSWMPDGDTVSAFRSSLRGDLLRPGEPGYDDARRIQNGLIDRHPALIVRCSGTADVVASVNFARDHTLPLSIRGGGHNVAGNAVNDGGLVIDLSGMRSVFVDPYARTARVQGGATGADLDRESQLFGLATTGGQVSSTGVAGLTLHGGMAHSTELSGSPSTISVQSKSSPRMGVCAPPALR